MRIVSLLPSATEICFALGLGDELVGVTHECDYPAGALAKPKVTASSANDGLSSREIDELVRSQLDNSGSIYTLDEAKLEELKPDLILTQRLCTVCAVSIDTVREVAARITSKPRVENLEPRNMNEVFETFRRVAEICGIAESASEKIAALQERLEKVRRLTKDKVKPKALVLEWIDPPFASGHWIPELIEIAGGENTVAFKWKPSREISWNDVREARADILISAACGFGIERQKKEVEIILTKLGLSALPTGGTNTPKVWICDGSQYFSRPGPRLVDTAEILAIIIHPELAAEYEGKFNKSDFENIDYGTTAQHIIASGYDRRTARAV
jgi:iron complex transport system substrate-binding protein